MEGISGSMCTGIALVKRELDSIDAKIRDTLCDTSKLEKAAKESIEEQDRLTKLVHICLLELVQTEAHHNDTVVLTEYRSSLLKATEGYIKDIKEEIHRISKQIDDKVREMEILRGKLSQEMKFDDWQQREDGLEQEEKRLQVLLESKRAEIQELELEKVRMKAKELEDIKSEIQACERSASASAACLESEEKIVECLQAELDHILSEISDAQKDMKVCSTLPLEAVNFIQGSFEDPDDLILKMKNELNDVLEDICETQELIALQQLERHRSIADDDGHGQNNIPSFQIPQTLQNYNKKHQESAAVRSGALELEGTISLHPQPSVEVIQLDTHRYDEQVHKQQGLKDDLLPECRGSGAEAVPVCKDYRVQESSLESLGESSQEEAWQSELDRKLHAAATTPAPPSNYNNSNDQQESQQRLHYHQQQQQQQQPASMVDGVWKKKEPNNTHLVPYIHRKPSEYGSADKLGNEEESKYTSHTRQNSLGSSRPLVQETVVLRTMRHSENSVIHNRLVMREICHPDSSKAEAAVMVQETMTHVQGVRGPEAMIEGHAKMQMDSNPVSWQLPHQHQPMERSVPHKTHHEGALRGALLPQPPPQRKLLQQQSQTPPGCVEGGGTWKGLGAGEGHVRADAQGGPISWPQGQWGGSGGPGDPSKETCQLQQAPFPSEPWVPQHVAPLPHPANGLPWALASHVAPLPHQANGLPGSSASHKSSSAESQELSWLSSWEDDDKLDDTDGYTPRANQQQVCRIPQGQGQQEIQQQQQPQRRQQQEQQQQQQQEGQWQGYQHQKYSENQPLGTSVVTDGRYATTVGHRHLVMKDGIMYATPIGHGHVDPQVATRHGHVDPQVATRCSFKVNQDQSGRPSNIAYPTATISTQPQRIFTPRNVNDFQPQQMMLQSCRMAPQDQVVQPASFHGLSNERAQQQQSNGLGNGEGGAVTKKRKPYDQSRSKKAQNVVITRTNEGDNLTVKRKAGKTKGGAGQSKAVAEKKGPPSVAIDVFGGVSTWEPL